MFHVTCLNLLFCIRKQPEKYGTLQTRCQKFQLGDSFVDLFNKILDLLDLFDKFVVDPFGNIVDLLFERGVFPHLENLPGYRPALLIIQSHNTLAGGLYYDILTDMVEEIVVD